MPAILSGRLRVHGGHEPVERHPGDLWQMDITGSLWLVDGRELKLVTGEDDHARFVVIATVVPRATERAVCRAFAAALVEVGCPDQVLTDNGVRFTGRYGKPRPSEVLFDRICRKNGIEHLLTKVRSPTTTGKIERWHQTLQRECLDDLRVEREVADALLAEDGAGRSGAGAVDDRAQGYAGPGCHSHRRLDAVGVGHLGGDDRCRAEARSPASATP